MNTDLSASYVQIFAGYHPHIHLPRLTPTLLFREIDTLSCCFDSLILTLRVDSSHASTEALLLLILPYCGHAYLNQEVS